MRKAGLVALLALAGCQQASDSPKPGPSKAGPSAIVAAGSSTPTPPPIAEPTPHAAPRPSASPTPVLQKHFQALGTEPFWSVEVLPGKLRYSSPEQPDGITFAATATSLGSAYRYAGTMTGAKVMLTITPGKCSDGMSDQTYAYTAALSIGDRAMRGCARLK